MRRQGHAVTEIAVAVGVAKSSVSRWVRDIPLTADQRDALIRRSVLYDGQWKGCAARTAAGRARRANYQQEGRGRTRRSGADYVAGCMLYWAEGDKDRHSVGFSNSDPAMMLVFLRFLRDHFGVQNEQVRIACNLFADHLERVTDVEQFWLTTLGLSQSSLRKTVVNRYSKHSKRKRTNVLPYGTCKLVVCSTKIVQTIYGSIQEYVGVERPEWLG
jgi:hypothetical protein